MKSKLSLLTVLAAVMLSGCSALGGDTKAEAMPAQSAPAYAENVTPAVTPAPVLETMMVTAPTTVSVTSARIDAAAFLNALVDSGCEIDEAEYKEVKRGGGIKVTCTKATDVLNTEGLGDL